MCKRFRTVAGLYAVSKATNESVESPLSGVVSSRIECEMVGTLLGERVEAEPTVGRLLKVIPTICPKL
jgi:hypothetical protein